MNETIYPQMSELKDTLTGIRNDLIHGFHLTAIRNLNNVLNSLTVEDDNQIALRKWDEYEKEVLRDEINRPMQSYSSWLQQED